MKEVHVITDLMWGSCSKRLFTEYYANVWKPDVIVSNALPNSGGYDSQGKKWSAIPIGYPCTMMISPASVVNLDDLAKEARQLPIGAEVLVHKNAGIITPQALKDEEKYVRIGSTMTGGAAVLKAKMDRDPDAKITAEHHLPGTIDNLSWLDRIHSAERVLVLCAQGHGLSINWGAYPYTTSRNTSPAQAIADCGIAPQDVTRIIGCARPFPIRVSNRYDDNGNMIGFSGPCYPDQSELSWKDIGVPEEITSVSKKVRRVFSFSHMQIREAVAITGCTDIFLGFLNYLPVEEQLAFVAEMTRHANVTWVGVDKTINDIHTTSSYTWDQSWV